jgi:hypothetical protein
MVHGDEIWLGLVEIQQDLYINLQSYLYMLQHNSATSPAATHPTREPLLQIYQGPLTVPCEIALHRSLCPGKLSLLFRPPTFCTVLLIYQCPIRLSRQPEPEFKPPMSEVLQSLVRVVQRSSMGLSSERNSCRFDESGDHTF